MTQSQQKTVGLGNKHWLIWTWKQFICYIPNISFWELFTNHKQQTLGAVLEKSCPENHIEIYQGLNKNIGGYNDKPVKWSFYSYKSQRLSVYSFTEVISNLHRYISINTD